jgi:hypothetical protein
LPCAPPALPLPLFWPVPGAVPLPFPLPLFWPLPLPVPLPLLLPPLPLPPTGAAPPDADETGMEVVVVVEVGVVVVVVVVVVGVVGVVGVVVLVPPPVGVEEPVPTTVRVAVGVELPRGDAVLPTAATCDVCAPPDETGEAALGGAPPTVPDAPVPADPPAPPAGAPGVLVLGGVVDGALGGPDDCAEISGWCAGPEPRLNPATTDRAAAATDAAATNRLRTKKGMDAVAAAGTTARAGVSEGACPNERDVKTSSKVA